MDLSDGVLAFLKLVLDVPVAPFGDVVVHVLTPLRLSPYPEREFTTNPPLVDEVHHFLGGSTARVRLDPSSALPRWRLDGSCPWLGTA